MARKQAELLLLLGLGVLGLTGIGFVPYLCFGDLARAGTFGDSFGFVNAFISGLAFMGVILALIFQAREIEAATKANDNQLQIAQKTARIQALTYLAEWHYRMMRETQGETQNVNKLKCEYFGERAVALMRELGETFPGQPSNVRIDVATDAEIAAVALNKILIELESDLEGVWDQMNTREANNVFGHAQRKVEQWVEEYQNTLDVRPVNTALSLLREKRANHSASSKDNLVKEYWDRGRVIVQSLHEAVSELKRQ